MEPEADRPTWVYASLTLVQPGWPGTTPANWVAVTAAGEQFRCADARQAMDRLGAEGWELVSFAPEVGDRSSCFYFKANRGT
jgi:hypothetical protein